MTGKEGALPGLKLGLLIVGIAAITLGVRVAMLFRAVAPPPVPEQGALRTLPPEPDQFHLRTTSAPRAVRSHLLAGNFKLVDRVAQIDDACRDVFFGSFVSGTGAAPSAGEVSLADPGQPFQSSDDLVPGVPFRRLVLAGVGPNSCFIYYQHGGSMYPRFCLAVIDRAQKKVVWLGESSKEARSIGELRRMLLSQQFCDSRCPDC